MSWTAFHEAIVFGFGSDNQIETVRLLTDGGADVTIPDGEGTSPRTLAAQRGCTEIVDRIETGS
ncbi:hypothetical protein [Brevibacterium casei]|uniref:hypothetical protein n=1 Tax=Brevibacterium casei TaxID=33889 RepID=UPI0031450874